MEYNKTMKKMLFLTKNFPPETGGGLRRIEAIYNLLSTNKNIKLEVITAVKNKNNIYNNVKFVKQLIFKDKKIKQKSNFTEGKSLIKLIDKALLGWLPNVVLTIMFLSYDFVYASAPSFTNIIAAFLYKKLRSGKPKIIIEYRDFFTLNPIYYDTKEKKQIAKFEEIILKNSDYIIVTTEAMKKILSKIVDPEKIFLIRNYISKSDTGLVKKMQKINFHNSNYNIGYIGKLNTGRNPEKLLYLLNKKISGKKVALHFIGIDDVDKNSILEIAKKLNLDLTRLKFMGVIDRFTSLKYMKSLDGLLLIINNNVLIKDGYGIPGKLYDYIYTKNNIYSDVETYNNLKSEFNCVVKKQFDGIINFSIKSNETLDDIFNDTINKIIS